MARMAKASLHVKRRLQPIERAVIAMGLELIARLRASDELQDVRLAMMPEGEFPSDDAIRALAEEIKTARKVKLCRTKRQLVV